MLAPKPAYFWDTTTGGWRPAVAGEPGEYTWNGATLAWEKGALGAEYVWNATTNQWDFGTLGGMYLRNTTTNDWEKVTEPGRGGPYYFDTTTGGWVLNTASVVSAERVTEAGDIRITEDGLVRVTE